MDFIYQFVVISLIFLFFVSFSLFIRRIVRNSQSQKRQIGNLQQEVQQIKAVLDDRQTK